MTAQLSREDLREIAYQGSFNELERELARMLLAGMDSDPDYIRYDCGCCGYETFTPISRCPSCNHKCIGETPLFTAPPAPVAVPDDYKVGEVSVGRLPTMNQDEYPGLGDWWVQLRIGKDFEEVLARVYGSTPQEANNRAEALACRASMLKTGTVTEATVPEGWKLVPVEPTETMLDAAYSHPASTEDRMRKQYVSMLAAAPAAPEQEV